jgi:Uma2 family endonuclease
MAGAITTRGRLVTGEELARMGNIGRCELIDGRIVPMTPTGDEHAGIESNVDGALRAFVRPRRLGKVRVGELGIYTRRNPDRVRGADVVFISNERYAQRSRDSAFLDVAPDLVVEILSPDDRVVDLLEKLREYFEIGVRLVWVVDPRARRVRAYRSMTAVSEFSEGDELSGEDILPGFAVPVADFFEE